MRRFGICIVFTVLVFGSVAVWAASPLETAMDGIVTRLYEKMSPDQLVALDDAALMPMLTPDERQVFSTQFLRFDVNVPVVVSVMRDVDQKVVPFWFGETGFKKTPLMVRNTEYRYEVWQKAFPAGRVELGVPGFERHRPVFFVAVGPRNESDKLFVTAVYPADLDTGVVEKGEFVYHDWPDLLLTVVPGALKGQVLLRTSRGRAQESHLVGAFRKTPYPSSDKPDQVVLTWSGDPRTTMAVQWRASARVKDGALRYRENGAPEWQEAKATRRELSDRFIVNDQQVSHFTAELSGLKPGTTYAYSVGGEPAEFTTAPATDAPFSFFFLSDTHNTPGLADLLKTAGREFPDTGAARPAFGTITGDLVGMGQNRDCWDALFARSNNFFATHPMVPCMGNHDCIDGLGADLYCAYFALPLNGPEKVDPERAYAFTYQNALFVVPDVTSSVEDQTAWIEEQLKKSAATWKFVEFHFPPYGDDNPDIVREWLPLFDKYHVDFVLNGHIHNYMRSYPLKEGKRVASNKDGTVYVITVSVGGDGDLRAKPAYAEVFKGSCDPLCTVFTVNGKRVELKTVSAGGETVDAAVYEK